MNKTKGIHFYINIKNLLDVIKQEESKDDDLKRTLHRLQTYFVGLSKLIGKYHGKVEKYTGGRCHVVFELNDEADLTTDDVMKCIVACFIYNNNIFNQLGKYTQYNYPDFGVHAGMDYGDYFEYDIEDGVNDPEFTSIGGVANNSAKIQSYAPKDYIYVTKKGLNELSAEIKEKFVELTDEEKEDFNEKIRTNKFYKARYSDIYDKDTMKEIEEDLADIKERVEEEADKLNILDIEFEGVRSKLSFENLSLKGKNKKFEGGVLCADIRGFTKLFYNNDQNLDDLADVMLEIYRIMGSIVNDSEGTKVQYQGDRIVAVFNDFVNAEDLIIRMAKAAFTLNEEIQKLNEDPTIKEKLNNNKISIGIGCGTGKIIATRLGLNGSKDNMILSDAYKKANTSEDRYAEATRTVICKQTKETIDEKVANTETAEYLALKELFTAVKKTEYYETCATLTEYTALIEQKKQLESSSQSIFKSTTQVSASGIKANVGVRPWGMKHGK